MGRSEREENATKSIDHRYAQAQTAPRTRPKQRSHCACRGRPCAPACDILAVQRRANSRSSNRPASPAIESPVRVESSFARTRLDKESAERRTADRRARQPAGSRRRHRAADAAQTRRASLTAPDDCRRDHLQPHRALHCCQHALRPGSGKQLPVYSSLLTYLRAMAR